MRFKFLAIVALLLLLIVDTSAQQEYSYLSSQNETLPLWVQEMYAENADPGKVISLYEKYYQNNELIKNSHTQFYKRWLRSISQEIEPNPTVDKAYLEQRKEQNNKKMASTWLPIGPIDWDHDAANRSYAPGCAHVYVIEQAPSNGDVLYAGTATAGIWKTVDHGLNWNPLTWDYLSNNCTSIIVDPNDEDIVYVELLSSVYKSTDGGTTFNPTGDATFQGLSLNIADMLIDPDNANTIYMCSTTGFYKTTDAGANWTQKQAGEFQEVEIHPTAPDTIYATTKNVDITEFWRSTDKGETFTLQTNGWPSPAAGEHNRRVEISVSEDDPDRVYAHATGSANGGSGLYGLYLSDDGGVNWTFECCGPQPAGPPSATNMNLMAWSDQGLDDGGQYYYDVGFEVSPFNKDSILLAGVNLWVSDDMGQSFVCPSKWSHSYKPNYVHADIHDIKWFKESGEIWIAGDGGIFFSDDGGANFHRRVKGISGTDLWGYGQGFWFGDVMLGGAYHNGTMLREEGTYVNDWVCTDGGDGIRGFVHPAIDRQVYSDYNVKTLQSDRTINPPTRTFQYKPNAHYITGRSSDMLFHPNYYHTYYTGNADQLIKTEDNGYTFQVVHDFNVDVVSMAMSDSNPDYIYVATYPGWWSTKEILRTSDGGNTWTTITPTVPNRSWICYDIEVDPIDPLHLWILRTNFYSTPEIDGASVYESFDGGDTWINISGTGLNGQSPTNLTHQKGSQGGLYVGTRRGVYHYDDNATDWTLYSSGLPASTHSVRLAPYYRKQLIRNASNRSVYEIDFAYPNTSVIAVPSVQSEKINCTQDTARFVDHSIVSENSVQWSWTFEGGNPATSTLRAPKVTYDCPGKYDVTLTVSDVNGSDTKVLTNFIEVLDDCSPDPNINQALNCVTNSSHVIVPDPNQSVTNFTISAWIKPNGLQDEFSGIFMNDGTSAGFNFRETNNTLGYHWPNGQWWWDSGLEVPENEWSYVAMVVNASGITVYLNGEGVTHNFTPGAVTLSQFRLGSYKGWTSRNFDGLIDEVCIWTRALSQDEIREKRHLRKIPANETGMMAYYDFDYVDNIAHDLANDNNGTFNGGANKMLSSLPVGHGTSDRFTVTGATTLNLPNTEVDFVFGSGTSPDGELVLSRIEQLPHTKPSRTALDKIHFVLNNYGANSTFNNLASFTINNHGIISNDFSLLSDNCRLDGRGENDDTNPWISQVYERIFSIAGNPGDVFVSEANDITQGGQWIITRDDFIAEASEVTIHEATIGSDKRSGGRSIGLSLISDNQGLRLPNLTLADLMMTANPTEGLMAYYSDKNTLIFFDGVIWKQVVAGHIDLPGTFSTIDANNGTSFGSPVLEPSAILSFEAGDGLVKLPLVNNTALSDIEFGDRGMMIYNSDLKELQYHDGISWNSLMSKASGITVATSGSGIANSGIVIGSSSRDPNAVLQLTQADKSLGLPEVDVYQIANPVSGLVIYDTTEKKLLIHDGTEWRKLIIVK